MKTPLERIKEIYGEDYLNKVKSDHRFLKKGKRNSKISNTKILKILSRDK